MWRRLCGIGSIIAAIVLVTSACGAADDSGGEAAERPADTTVIVDDPAPQSQDDESTEPEALAMRESDAGEAEIAETDASGGAAVTAAPAEVLPPIEELDAGLADFASCLNDNGVEVGAFTLQDMVAKASQMPLVETRAEMFAFFLDTDGSDPVFQAAVAECNPIVDAIPGLGAFLPAS